MGRLAPFPSSVPRRGLELACSVPGFGLEPAHQSAERLIPEAGRGEQHGRVEEGTEIPAIVRHPDGSTLLVFSFGVLRLERDGALTLLSPDGRINLPRSDQQPANNPPSPSP